MKVHKIKVRDRAVSCDDLELVQGTQGVDAVALDLDPEWTGLELTVTFSAASGRYTPARSGGLWPVPWEVLKETGEVEVGIEGRRGTDVLKSVRMPWPFRVRPSLEVGELPSDPTVSEYQKVWADCTAMLGSIDFSLGDDGHCYVSYESGES